MSQDVLKIWREKLHNILYLLKDGENVPEPDAKGLYD